MRPAFGRVPPLPGGPPGGDKRPWLHRGLAVLRPFFEYVRERRCAACHAPYLPPDDAQGAALHACPTCLSKMPLFTSSACPLCGRPWQEPDAPATLCGQCLTDPPPWEALHFYGLYQNLMQTLMLNFKFARNFSLTPLFGALLAHVCAPSMPFDVILPIPRHHTRLMEQGCNHVHELAHHMGKELGIPTAREQLRRTRNTLPQLGLSAKRRQTNPKDSFVAEGVQGLRVLIVDDTMTTGATLRHAAMAVHKAQGASICAAVVARAALLESA